MKTLIIYNDCENPLRCIVVDGDFSHFNGVIVNGVFGTGAEDEFCEWMWDEEGNELQQTGWSEDVSTILEGKAWDKVAFCTFLP